MIHLADSVLINEVVAGVYNVAQDVKKHPEVIPYFKKVEILAELNNTRIVKRTAEIQGKLRVWTGRLVYHKNKLIEYEQIEGPLKGMKGAWIFEHVDGQTRLTITHNFDINIFLVGRLLELLIKNTVRKSAQRTLKCIKEYVEKKS